MSIIFASASRPTLPSSRSLGLVCSKFHPHLHLSLCASSCCSNATVHRIHASYGDFEAWLDVRRQLAATADVMAATAAALHRTALSALAVSIFATIISGTALAAVALYAQTRAVRARMATELAARSRFLRGLMHEVS